MTWKLEAKKFLVDDLNCTFNIHVVKRLNDFDESGDGKGFWKDISHQLCSFCA